MKAAVMEAQQRPITVKHVEDPSVGPSDVLIKVEACGICRTDIHIVDGWMKDWFGLDPFPIIPGHEVTGTIAEVGDAVTRFKVGDRVAAFYLFTCGRCEYCLSGYEQTCETLFTGFNARGFTSDGGYAEYMPMPEDFVIGLPDKLDFIQAAPLVCGGLTAYGAIKQGKVGPNKKVAVLGIGGIGHLAIQMANALGAEVIAITGSDDKVQLVKELGAHHVIVGREAVGSELQAMGGADTIISATVDPQTVGQMLAAVRPRGTLILIGLTPPGETAIAMEPGAVLFGQQRITGNLMGSRQDMKEMLHLVANKGIRTMSEVYPLDEVNKAHDRVRNNQARFRAILTPH